MSAYSSFALSSDGPIARLTLNRPDKRNTMTPAFWRELPEAVMALSDAGETRVLILDAEGPVFSAGMDISVFTDPAALKTDGPAARDILAKLDPERLPARLATRLDQLKQQSAD